MILFNFRGHLLTSGGERPKNPGRKVSGRECQRGVYKWFLSAREQNVPVNGIILKDKAVFFAKELNIKDFQTSNGWLERWKTRNNISFKTVAGEAKSCTPIMTASWNEILLPTILSKYKHEDIYNADEFGLFYQSLPEKTLHFKSEKCIGGKLSNVRLTGLAAGNAVGEKLPMFVIGKSAKPRCCSGVKNLLCR